MPPFEDEGSSVDSEEYDSDDLDLSEEEDLDPFGSIGGSALFQSLLGQIPREGLTRGVEDSRSPQQHWKDFLHQLEESKTKVLKVTDACAHKYGLESAATAVGRRDVVGGELIEAIESARGITHAILGNKILQLLRESEQQKLLQKTIVRTHRDTLAYLKLGSDDSSEETVGILETSSFLEAFAEEEGSLSLSEVELRGLELKYDEEVDKLSGCLKQTSRTIRQFNLFHARVSPSVSLDPLVEVARLSPCLDELRLVVVDKRKQPVISTAALSDLLSTKKKWWRLALDGLGLTDHHCFILAQMFSRDETCKVGDLLSLLHNHISERGYSEMFSVFFYKQRMGLIKVDDKTWENNFDLVRSMNNLHGRPTFVDQGSFRSRSKFVDWLAKLGNLAWEDEKHKLNYIWFSLLEKPDFLPSTAG